MKYRKKPIVIEAFQMTQPRRWDNSEWPEWLHVAWNKPRGEGSIFIDDADSERERLCVGTSEGCYRLTWNDWIIKGIKGELYPCKPDVFAATYDPEPTDMTSETITVKIIVVVTPVGDYTCAPYNGDDPIEILETYGAWEGLYADPKECAITIVEADVPRPVVPPVSTVKGRVVP